MQSVAEAVEVELAQGRATLDERHFGRAEALLRTALPCITKLREQVRVQECDPRSDGHELLLYADVLQHGHDFENAERVLAIVLEANPSHAQALLLRASIRFARGEPGLALGDCSRLVGAIDVTLSTACIAQAIGTTGRLDQSVSVLSNVLNAPGDQTVHAAWTLAILADLLERQGKYADAMAAIERAIAADTANASLRIQAADLMLRHGAAARAEQVLEPLPPTGSIILRRAMAAQVQRRADAMALRTQWLAMIEAEQRLGLRTHDRDRAMGELRMMQRPHEALKFAAINWRTSRDIDDARILISAAVAAGRPDGAAPALNWVREHQVEDALIASMLVERE
jgi:tetratricopeptide (TPR) repeat protein